MNDPGTYQFSFEKALEYAYKVVPGINANPVEQEDLIQEFCLEVLEKEDKYREILDYKSTVYNILRGKNSNRIRKQKPVYSDIVPDSLTTPTVSQEQKHAEYIESILYQSIQFNGRNKAVLSFKKQQDILRVYSKSKLSTRAFCSQMGISTATLHQLKKNGPKIPEKPRTIQYFLLRHIEGKSIDEIADMFGVTKHSVSQNIHYAKKKIDRYLAHNDLMNCDLEPDYL